MCQRNAHYRYGLGSSALVGQLVKEKENSEFKPVILRLKKLTLCHILPERRGWVQKKGGARGVMVIVAGYGHGNTNSNPGRD